MKQKIVNKIKKDKNSTHNPNNIIYNYDNSLKPKVNIKHEFIEKNNVSKNGAEKILKKIDKKDNYEIYGKTGKKVSNNKIYNINGINSVTDLNNTQENPKIKNKNIDNILKDLIPYYEKKTSIELKNVDLTFDVTTEKIDTIKEQFIRTLKRNKIKKRKLHVLENISFKIYQGEKVGIIGYNGAGKSTLLSVITGIYIPDEGTVETYGKIAPLLSLGAGFDYNYTGRENILLNGAVLGYEKQFLLEKIDEIIEFSELGEFIDLPIKNYSSGMLAKLGFSIATIVEPDILIIDEILGVGDVNFQKKSHDKIKSIMDGKTTVLLVSHSIPQIRELCEKAIWIDQGKVKEIGEVNKVCDNYLKDAEKATKSQLANIKFN